MPKIPAQVRISRIGNDGMLVMKFTKDMTYPQELLNKYEEDKLLLQGILSGESVETEGRNLEGFPGVIIPDEET